MSDIQALGQQISKLISDSNQSATYLYNMVGGLRRTTEATQHLMQSTAQHNYQTLVNHLSVAQINLANAASDLIYAANVAAKWVEKHVDGIATTASFLNTETVNYPEPQDAITEITPFAALSEYMSSRNYGKEDFPPSYSNDPMWRVLHKAAFPENELPPIDQATAWALLQQYMSDHNYNELDETTYMQDPVWQELHQYAFPKSFTRPDPNESSQQYSIIVDALNQRNIGYRKIELFGKARTAEEIIDRLGGGDKTDGSCSSLAFAYAGNLAGYDVLDFRDGDSRKFFSSDESIRKIADLPSIVSFILTGKDEVECSNQLLRDMQPDKEYYLATGRHAAIVRKVGNHYEYLELQRSNGNGWYPLNDDVLQHRFRCQRSFIFECPSFLIDVESLSNCHEFLDLLGYINTAEPDQVKGESGYAR